MDSIFRKLDEFVLAGMDSMVIGCSGGVDSMALIHICKEYSDLKGVSVRAIHINHNAQDANDDWAVKVEDWCGQIGVKLDTYSINVDYKSNFEMVARKERQEIVGSTIIRGEWYLTAHHMGDVAEGLILAMARGSGIAGMSGMNEVGIINGYMSGKPLLGVEKNDLYSYCHSNDIGYVEDPTNKESVQDRNFIRNNVIPLLESRWPDFVSSASLTANNLNKAKQVISEVLPVNDSTYKISGKGFDDVSEADNIGVRLWLSNRFNKSAGNNIINTIYSVGKGVNGGVVERDGFKVGIWRGVLYDLNSLPSDRLECGGQVDRVALRGDVGNSVVVNGINKKLNKVFRDNLITPWDRDAVELGFVNDELKYLGSVRI